MNLTWLLRMSRWARHPPSWRRVVLGAAVIGLCLALAGVEWLGWWPDWATVDKAPRRPKIGP